MPTRAPSPGPTARPTLRPSHYPTNYPTDTAITVVTLAGTNILSGVTPYWAFNETATQDAYISALASCMAGVRAGQITITDVTAVAPSASRRLQFKEPQLRGSLPDPTITLQGTASKVTVAWQAVFLSQQIDGAGTDGTAAASTVTASIYSGVSTGTFLAALVSEDSSSFSSTLVQSISVGDPVIVQTRTDPPTMSPTDPPHKKSLNERAAHYISKNITIYGFILAILGCFVIYGILGFSLSAYYRMERAVITKEYVMERRRTEPAPTLSTLARSRQLNRTKSENNAYAGANTGGDGADREHNYDDYDSPMKSAVPAEESLTPKQRARLMLKRTASQSAGMGATAADEVEMGPRGGDGATSGSPVRNKELARAKTRERLKADMPYSGPMSPESPSKHRNPLVSSISSTAVDPSQTSVLRSAVAKLQREKSMNVSPERVQSVDSQAATPNRKQMSRAASRTPDRSKLDML
jgi:hypothetical protein